ncbi:hypothetical protein [Actinoplanes sp. G11-F43]|uniref:hypothetical protein n=1 Tax=Actinoplanes sp. G11-F43 TaxID=3424130 RepID=UPI003D3492A8
MRRGDRPGHRGRPPDHTDRPAFALVPRTGTARTRHDRAQPDQGVAHRVALDEWQMTSVTGRVFANRADTAAVLALAKRASLIVQAG